MPTPLRFFLIAFALLLSTTVRAELFLDGFLGKSFTDDADVHVQQHALGNDFTVHDLAFDDESFQSPPYYGFRAGYWLESHPWLGFGAEFFHFKIVGDTGDTRRFTGTHGGAPIDVSEPVDAVVQAFKVTHGVNYLMANAYVRHGFVADDAAYPHGRVQVYGGGGLGPVIGHPENEIDHVENHQQYELAGLGGQLLLGARFLVFRWAGLFAEYKYTLSGLDVGVRHGSADLAERTHHIIFGITTALPTPW